MQVQQNSFFSGFALLFSSSVLVFYFIFCLASSAFWNVERLFCCYSIKFFLSVMWPFWFVFCIIITFFFVVGTLALHCCHRFDFILFFFFWSRNREFITFCAICPNNIILIVGPGSLAGTGLQCPAHKSHAPSSAEWRTLKGLPQQLQQLPLEPPLLRFYPQFPLSTLYAH